MRKWNTKGRCAGVGALALAILSLLFAGALLPTEASAADPELIWKRCIDSHNSGLCELPIGIAADPATGEVYVANRATERLEVFSPWGELIRAWGWGVVDGSSELQACGPGANPPTASCEEGLEGEGVGQLHDPRGVALDSNGNVYVVDLNNHRVQKFDPEGNFLLMFGGEVDKGGGTPSNPGNVCTAQYIANGDTCGAGSTGTANGQFGEWALLGAFIAIDPSTDTVFVGDENRIQKFDSQGNYTGQLPLPEPGLVRALAVDPVSGDLYFAYYNPGIVTIEQKQPDVYRLDPTTGAMVGQPLEARIPRSIATDTSGHVYVYDSMSNNQTGAPDEPPNHLSRILEFDSSGSQIAKLLEGEFKDEGGIEGVEALATGTGCGIAGADLYVGNFGTFGRSFFAAYGPPPNPTLCPPPAAAPTIEDTYAASADTTGATVRAGINPHFWNETTYYVQYGTGKCSEGACNLEKPAAPGSKLAPKVVNTAVDTAGVFLDGLQPGTTYHFRFVAKSGGGGPVIGPERTLRTYPLTLPLNTNCPNQVFRTGNGARLPDCRAYEMVSPVDKNNGDLTMQIRYHFVQASPGGERMTFSSFRAFGEAEAAPIVSQYLASRDPQAGWSTENITPPREATSYYPILTSESIQYKAFSEDLCSGWVVQDTGLALTPGSPPFVPNLYRRDLCDPKGYALISSVVPPGFGHEGVENEYYPEIQGFSKDNSRSFFRADASLTPNAAPKKLTYQVYVAYGEGKLRLVSVLPNGNAATTNSSVGTPQTYATSLRENSVQNAVSEDGSRVYWSNGEKTGLSYEQGRLYLRLNATLPPGKCSEAAKACTLLVSPDLQTLFIAADPQGERAIYEVNETQSAGGELFEYDLATQSSQLIAKGIEGVMGTSEDATRVYFASNQVLSGEQENSAGDKAQAGGLNLYRYDAAGGGSLTFVATLSAEDATAHEETSNPFPSPLSKVPMRRLARVSPDGEHAAFISRGSLTGYDNTDLKSGKADSEVFLYDAEGGAGAGKLLCASCNPSGARPAGRFGKVDAIINSELQAAAYIPGWQSQIQPTRVLAEDGSRLFFNSLDALLPRDTNGRMDVYEWEEPGSGDCTEESADFFASNGGCLSLISSGESPEDSEFFDAGPEGKDVFFATQASLVEQDPSAVDVYDARIGGGFPPPPEPAPSCEGEACQGPLAPPNDPTPGSSSFEGAGNVTEAKKKKDKAKKHGKKHKKNKHAKKHKRTGAKGRQGR